jgi:DNA-binding response OmpR family regulator
MVGFDIDGALRGRRCLVVDDDANIREIVGINLEAEAMLVQSAANGQEALDLAGSFAPDLIVLDVMMPDQSGYDVLSALRSNPDTRHIPVILLTAKATDRDIWQGWQSGASYYMTKPFTVDQLLYSVRTVVAGGLVGARAQFRGVTDERREHRPE